MNDLGEVDMASPQTLADFITWGISNYPADRIGLVLWDHGAGVPGFAVDDGANPKAIMSLPNVRNAVAAGFSPFAEYLLASEETEPGHGWDYRVFAAARQAPGISAPDLGAAVIDGYAGQASQAKTGARITLSLVDLTKIGALVAAIEQLGDALKADYATFGAAVGQVVGISRQASLEFGASGQQRGAHVDIGAFVDQLAARIGNQTAEKVTAVKAALAGAVVTRSNGPETASASGLSLYFPVYPAQYATSYDNVQEAKGWRVQLRSYYNLGSELEQPPELSQATGGWSHACGA